MLLYYVRHGDPIYDPDSLTPLGMEQAAAVARRLAKFGVDEIYSSPSKAGGRDISDIIYLATDSYHYLGKEES